MKMKNSTPLPRTRTATALLFFLFFNISSNFAQSNSDKTSIKEWLVANKDKITLVSMKEYQAMSPAVKAVLDADSKTLVYNTEVTMDNIYAFENKNVGKNLAPFRTERQKANEAEAVARASKTQQDADLQAFKAQEEATLALQERQNAELQVTKERRERVSIWLEANKHRNIKIISYQDYMSRPAAQKAVIDALSDKIIYANDELTWEEIEQYEKSK